MTAIGPKECPNDDGRADTAMAAIIGHHGPDLAALGGLPPRVQHRSAGFIDKDAVRAAQMGTHVVDDRHQVELRGTVAPVGRRKPQKRTTNPVAERTPIQIDPLPFEDPAWR